MNLNIDAKKNIEVSIFFQALQKLVIEASKNQHSSDYDINLADINVRLSFFGHQLSDILLPALSHIIYSSVTFEKPQYQIYVLDGTTIDSPFPAIEGITNKFIFRGDIEDFSTYQHQIAYLIHSKLICAIDHINKIGIVIAQDSKLIPKFISASPLKEIFNWIMLRNQCSLIHAAAVGNQDGAVLLVGKSGSGKSVTAIRCLFYGFDFYGDDIVGISNKKKPLIHSIFSTAKIFNKDIAKITGLKKYYNLSNLKPNEKEVFFLSEYFKEQLPIKMSIKAILHVIQSDDTASITPASVANILNVVGSTSVTIFPYSHQTYTIQLMSLFKSVPCFNFELGNQTDQIALTLGHFLKSMANNSH
jgi:hypothetical protein